MILRRFRYAFLLISIKSRDAAVPRPGDEKQEYYKEMDFTEAAYSEGVIPATALKRREK